MALLVRRLLHRISRPQCPVYTSRHYGEWVKSGAGNGTSSDKGTDANRTMTVFGGYADEYDACRPSYPADMWTDFLADWRSGFPAGSRPFDNNDGSSTATALDIAAGTGRGVLELARQGFCGTAIDLDPGMLAQAKKSASMAGLTIQTHHGAAEDTGLPSGFAQLLVCLQAFHWFDSQKALAEFQRILDPATGICLIAWNDRDLSAPMMKELEEIFTRYNPIYDYRLKLAEHVCRDGELLTEGGFFGFFEHFDDGGSVGDRFGGAGRIAMRSYPNPTPGMTADSLMALCQTFSYVKNALEDNPTALHAFEADVRQLVFKHHGKNEFTMPWVTKAFILRPT